MRNLTDKRSQESNNKKELRKEMQMVLKHRTRCSILRIENKCKLKSTLLVKKNSIPTHYLANVASVVMAGTRRNKQVQRPKEMF